MNRTLLVLLGDTLLHSLWQGTVVAVVAWAIARSSGQRVAYLSYLGALVALPLIPAVSLVRGLASLDDDVPVYLTRGLVHSTAAAVWQPTAVVFWGMGVGVMSAWLLLGLVGQGRLRRNAVPLDAFWQRLVDEAAESLGLRRSVPIAATEHLGTPAVLGYWRPLIVVPLAMLTEMPTSYWRAVVTHELAHVKRRDAVVQAMQRVVEVLMYYHPAVWWLSRRIDVLREVRCDALAAEALDDRLTYARALASFEEARHTQTLPGLAFTGKGTLMERIRHIVEPHSVRRPSLWSRLLPMTLIGAVGILSTGVASCSAEPDETAQTGAQKSGLTIRWMPQSVLEHERAIVEAAARHDLDPDLVSVLVLVESGGNALAASPMGARGLMQLMPETAAKVAQQSGIGSHSVERLDDPAYNLDLGARFLAEQLRDFGGGASDARAVGLAAAAYNGGPGQLTEHLAGQPLSDETARYQKIVVALWAERGAGHSATLDARRSRR